MTQAERVAGAIAYFSSQAPTDIESLIPTHPIDDVELTIYRHMQTALDALRGPVPDTETGLVRCGCGGKVECKFYEGWHGVPDLYQVDCFNCHVGTRPHQNAEQAKDAWNTAHGYKEDA